MKAPGVVKNDLLRGFLINGIFLFDGDLLPI